jgi:xanthine/CO dehydrogenase XdhC/CoxF family maturation factor
VKELQDILREARSLPDEFTALATVVRTAGSSYRRPGARRLVRQDGKSIGAISGGCLEDEVVLRARDVLDSGEGQLIALDTRALFGCDGLIEILIERLPLYSENPLLQRLAHSFAHRKSSAIMTVFQTTAPEDLPLGSTATSSEDRYRSRDFPPLREICREEAIKALAQGQSRNSIIENASAKAAMFVHIVPPPVRLLIAGSGIDTLPVISCAQMLGWQTTLLIHPAEIFDREQFRRADEIVIAYPKEFEITADAQTAAMIMTHNYGRDLAWLRTFLPMPLRYVGLLGPKRRREKLLADLAEHGLELSHISLAHLYNPAGLDLGAESSEEIALSITAEIKMVLSCCGGGSLRSRKGPIHDLRVEAGRQSETVAA